MKFYEQATTAINMTDFQYDHITGRRVITALILHNHFSIYPKPMNAPEIAKRVNGQTPQVLAALQQLEITGSIRRDDLSVGPPTNETLWVKT